MRLFADRHRERADRGGARGCGRGAALQFGGAESATVRSVLGRMQVVGRARSGRVLAKKRLREQAGAVAWEKVVELLVVNRLIEPRSELFIHEKWFPQTAMSALLDSDERVAEKDRLYRALDRMVEHKEALEEHLADRWKDLFGASFDVLLYDLTSTYFEGEAEEVDKAQRGYSRDHRPDCKQLIIALVVSPEGFPLSYEVFAGNRADVTTLEEMLEAVERKHGRARRVWVFDRGIVSEENLQRLRRTWGQLLGGHAPCATQKLRAPIAGGRLAVSLQRSGSPTHRRGQ